MGAYQIVHLLQDSAGWLAPGAAALGTGAGLAVWLFGECVLKPAAMVAAALLGAVIGALSIPIALGPDRAPGALGLGAILGLAMGAGVGWLAFRWLVVLGMGLTGAVIATVLALVAVPAMPGPRAAAAAVVDAAPAYQPKVTVRRSATRSEAAPARAEPPRMVMHLPPNFGADESAPAGRGQTPAPPTPDNGSLTDPAAIAARMSDLNSGTTIDNAIKSVVVDRLRDVTAGAARAGREQIAGARGALSESGFGESMAALLPDMETLREFASRWSAREQGLIVLACTVGWGFGMMLGFRAPRLGARVLSSALGAALALGCGAALMVIVHAPWAALVEHAPAQWAMLWSAAALLGVFVQYFLARRSSVTGTA